MWQTLALGSLLDRTQDTFPDLQRKHCFSVFAQKNMGWVTFCDKKYQILMFCDNNYCLSQCFATKKHPIFTLSELTERKGSCSTQSNITAPEFRQVTQMATWIGKSDTFYFYHKRKIVRNNFSVGIFFTVIGQAIHIIPSNEHSWHVNWVRIRFVLTPT